MITRTATKNYLLNIQVLRFVAAFLVVLGHVLTSADRMPLQGDQLSLTRSFADSFGIGVDIFFIISGFIMFYLCHDKFGQKGQSSSFLLRRFIRVVPIYWAFTALMVASILIFADQVTTAIINPEHLLASLAFIPWMNPDGIMRPVLKLGWTLNYEIFFYLAFGLALNLPRRIALPVLFSVFLMAVAFNAFVPSELWILKFWSDPIILEFLLGIGLAAAFLREWRLSFTQSAALIALACFTLIFLVPVAQLHGVTFRPLIFGIPSLMICAAFAFGPQMSADRLLDRALVLFGTASYCLYLSHPFILNAVERMGIGWWSTHPGAFVMAACVASVFGSIGLYLWLERPLVRLFSRFGKLSTGLRRAPAEPLAVEKS
ncbi:acyltransferase [Terrihabitans rhizophilus]|uniref:Acyltransferase n=1 Tax=Terrihabitans rhizophilus TaxID=3092662 RepID=A0ABU4RNZ9_9HYPH|nr:acyltransferase [Terrihabitans sp. PJ23]MDX6805380.1 acyltransferase [Terrihabitans sp. PJ23]